MKSLLQSKTFWIAVSQSIIAVIVIFQSNYDLAGGVLLVKSALDVFIRLSTTEAVK